MTTEGSPPRRGLSPMIWGSVLVVCGIGLAVVGFTDAGAFLGVTGCVLAACGAIAVILGVSRRSPR